MRRAPRQDAGLFLPGKLLALHLGSLFFYYFFFLVLHMQQTQLEEKEKRRRVFTGAKVKSHGAEAEPLQQPAFC